MLNKLQFNNLVISNKKGIQQARTQTINKLVHKIRKLKALLEKHPDNTKCKERIRKSTEAMEWLKKLKRIDIMKQVLLIDKLPAAIITNGLATPDEVGVALLAMNKVMQGLVKRFKTELKLDDKESDKWKEALKESSKRKQKIERTEEKRRKRIEMKEQKVMGRNREEWLEKNNQGVEGEQENVDTGANVSTVGNWKIEELETDEKITKITKNNEKKKVSDLKRPLKEKPAMKKEEIHNKRQKKDVVLTKQIMENENQSSEEDGQETSENMVSHEESMSENDTSEKEDVEPKLSDEQKEDSQDSEEETEETLVVDPFFITDTGENYLSTAVIKRGQNTENEDNEGKRDLHMIKLNSNKKPNDFRDRRQQSKDANQQNFKDRNNQTRDRYSQKQNKWNNEGNGDQKYPQNKWSKQNDRNEKYQKNNRNNNKERDHRDKDFKTQKPNNLSANKTEPNLHPSWAAKQKLKPVIASFQGKKITFGDDDNCNKTSNTFTQPEHNSNRNKPTKTSMPDKDSLHPSWVAKQKLKPTISAFQGKKITFDNDD